MLVLITINTSTTVSLSLVIEEGGREVILLVCSDDIPREALLNTSYKEHSVVTRGEITTTCMLKPSGMVKISF